MAAVLDLTNRTISGYRCVTKIAAGGMGTIWKAENLDGRAAAIKIIHPELAKTRQAQTILLNEFRLCKTFAHANLLKYMDCGTFEGTPYMVMEHFPGGKLTDCMRDKNPCSVFDKGREIIVNVAQALAYIHERGIVHRDIKPDNIMVNAEGQTRLIDFSSAVAGLAKWLPFMRKTEGTPSYIAPELIKRRPVTPAVDMYSFGATIYEMFAGRPPFVGDTQNQVLNRHLKAKPESLTRFNKDLTQELDGLVLRMLAKKPAERPPDMTAFLREFQRLHLFRH